MNQQGTADRESTLRLALIIALLSMLAPFSIDTYLPSFPDIGRELGVTSLQLQQTLSLYLVGFACMTLIYGPLADAFGRRIVILSSVAVYIATSIGCALASDFHWLLAMRIGQGLSASGGLIVGRAVIRDAFSGSRAQRALSNVMLVFALAPAVAPIIGGWLHSLAGWRSVFWFLAGLGVFLWLLVATRLPETLAKENRRSPHPKHIARSYARALRSPRFLLLIAIFSLNFGAFFLYVAGSPVVIYKFLGFGAHDFWVMFVPVVMCLMLGAFLSGRLAGRRTPVQTASIGAALMFIGATLNVLSSRFLPVGPVAILVPLGVYVTGMALSMPSISLTALDVFPHHRGLSSALQGFGRTMFNGLVAGVITPLVAVTPLTMAVTMFGLNLAGVLLWLVWRQRYRNMEPEGA